MLPTDLRDYRASNGFQLFTDEEAAVIVAVLLIAAIVADQFGWLTK